jgi:hypothetical protein
VHQSRVVEIHQPLVLENPDCKRCDGLGNREHISSNVGDPAALGTTPIVQRNVHALDAQLKPVRSRCETIEAGLEPRHLPMLDHPGARRAGTACSSAHP